MAYSLLLIVFGGILSVKTKYYQRQGSYLEDTAISFRWLFSISKERPMKDYRKIYCNHLEICFSSAIRAGYDFFRNYEKFLSILSECSKWYDYKLYLDGVMPNVHSIVLETE